MHALANLAQADTITQLHLSGEAVLVGLLAIIGFFTRNKLKAYDKHLETCHRKEVNLAVIESTTKQKISSIEHRTEQMSVTMQWVGDSLIRVASKLDVDLPDRPYNAQHSTTNPS